MIHLLALLLFQPFVTGSIGVTALTSDATTSLTPPITASLYSTKTGPTFNVGGGVHFNNWIGAQLSCVANRNPVELQGIRGPASFSWAQQARQTALVGEAMLYFRPRNSLLRPYLSTGLAAVRSRRRSVGSPSVSGEIPLPAAETVNWRPGLRVAVGIDVMLRQGWGFRYSFSEILTKNPISQSLTPPASRNLMSFQNLFGFVKYF